MAGLPPSRNDVHRRLWIPDLREGSFFPLSLGRQNSLPATCPTQRLSTQRLRRCGLSATFPIQSLPCVDGLLSRLSRTSRVARAARRKHKDVYVVIYDAVILAPLPAG